MIAGFLLALREGLEAALIIGIVIGVIRKVGRTELTVSVWAGAATAVLLSVLGGIGLNAIGARLEGAAEEIFEGFAMLLAAAVLTWMIFWMQRQSSTLRSGLESDVQQAALAGGKRALFFLAFLAVLREGIELALFLTAIIFTAGGPQTLGGALLGLGAAVVLGWLIFASTVKLDVRRFFTVTGGLLLLFAAGLVAHGVHEFNEVGWIPSLVEHVWDINHLLDEKSTAGLFLKALFGYNGNPSLSELIAYVAYLVLVLLGLRRSSDLRQRSRLAAANS